MPKIRNTLCDIQRRKRPKSLITGKKSTEITEPKSQTLCDVSDSFAFDIMSCSPTLDKCDKFGDYFCSTSRNYNLPSLALGASSV